MREVSSYPWSTNEKAEAMSVGYGAGAPPGSLQGPQSLWPPC